MRRTTVRKGLWTVIAGMLLVTVGTFYHSAIAELLNISVGHEERFISFAFFWGGMLASFGVVVAVVGIISAAAPGDQARLLPVIAVLVLTVFFFFYLLSTSLSGRRSVEPHPGESITI